MAYDAVVIIYNPVSTGDSKSNAVSFKQKLAGLMPHQEIILKETEYAGHAEKITAGYAMKRGTWLVISSSGDGGYNEVINGALLPKTRGKVITAVLPSGNANDHHAAMSSDNMLENIKHSKIQKIDVIRVESGSGDTTWQRHAHSYAGFGITPKVGRELTRRKLNAFNEKWYVIKYMIAFKHVTLEVNSRAVKYSSLVFATISRMSKVVKLAEDASQDDGMMEMYETQYQTPLGILKLLLTAGLTGIKQTKRLKQCDLKTTRPTLIQLDGEVFKLEAHTEVRLTCQKSALATIV